MADVTIDDNGNVSAGSGRPLEIYNSIVAYETAANPLPDPNTPDADWEDSAQAWKDQMLPLVVRLKRSWAREANAHAAVFIRQVDVPPTPTVGVQRIQDPSRIGEASNVAWTLSNFTTALGFHVHRTLSLLGADIWVKLSGTRNLKVTLWNAQTGVSIVTKTFNSVAANAGRVRFLFNAPVSLAPLVLNAGYRLSVYDLAGVDACGSVGVQTNTTVTSGDRSHIVRPDVYSNTGWFLSGADGFPNSNGTTTMYPICPAFSDDDSSSTPATVLS